MVQQNTESFTLNKYPSLNGLRAISILLVILHHLKLQYTVIPGVVLNYFPLLTDGPFGVNVFFVISGFLITRLLLNEEHIDGKISLKRFYVRRILRIFPAYYFLLLVYFVLCAYGYMNISGESWLTSLTYTKYFNWNRDWYTSHAWSLSVEEHFYIMWPLFFIAGKRVRTCFIFSILLLVPVLRILFNCYPQEWANGLTIFYRLDAIATGCLFAMYQDKIITLLSPSWKKIFYGCLTALFLLPFINTWNDQYHLRLDFFTIPFGGTFSTAANILIACIMMFSVFGPRGRWFSMLNTGILNRIGTWSYSLYLWQQLFICRTVYFINRFPFNLLFIFIAAIGSYYLIEKPFLKLKAKFAVRYEKEIPEKNISPILELAG